MIVVTLTSCPSSLKGDLTLWLQEIDTGVYVGSLSARVRDELWMRIIENVEDGSATMIYNTNNEQGMEFRVHNALYMPIDFDGIKLIMKLKVPELKDKPVHEQNEKFVSKAQSNRLAKIHTKGGGKSAIETFVVLDIETTGLNPAKDRIVEVGAIAIKENSVNSEFNVYFLDAIPLPKSIKELTGLTDQKLLNSGIETRIGLQKLKDFCNNMPIVSHNSNFDYNFLRIACSKVGLDPMTNQMIDTLQLARSRCKTSPGFSLGELAQYLGLANKPNHSALQDCYATYDLYMYLNNEKNK